MKFNEDGVETTVELIPNITASTAAKVLFNGTPVNQTYFISPEGFVEISLLDDGVEVRFDEVEALCLWGQNDRFACWLANGQYIGRVSGLCANNDGDVLNDMNGPSGPTNTGSELFAAWISG